MSVASGPNITTLGLALNIDMTNTQKSWIGRPSTNTCNYDIYNYTDGNATVTRGVTPPIAPPVTGYEISKMQSNNGANTQYNILYTSNVDQVNGGVYTHSAWILLTAGTYCQVGQHWNPWDPGVYQYIPLNVWTRVSYTVTNGTNNYGNIANSYGTDGTIYITAVQYEQGSTATPFMGGTGASRSSTQAIVDLTGNNTITATSLTYASDGTFSFNGSSNYLSIPNTTLGNGNIAWTVSCWMKTTTTTNVLGGGSVLSNISGGPVYSMMGVNNGKIVYWTYQSGAWAQKLGVGITVNDGNWHMLTWVNYSNSTMDMYVDGLLDSNVANSTSGNNNPVDVIGRSWAAYFPGSIASLTRYTRSLSAGEIRQQFAALRGRFGI
jgi:hypothetical protein